MSLLNDDGRKKVLHYYQLRDAKMALASCLLKPYAVSRLFKMRWSETLADIITKDPKTKTQVKPYYMDPATDTQPVAFNVSHQAGIVIVAAVANYPPRQAEVGVDIVCTSENRLRDHRTVMEDATGWSKFVETHDFVLADEEAAYLKHKVLAAVPQALDLPPNPTAEQVADAKLRAFYALWCLREAYVKLDGQGLTAPTLKHLEFRNVKPTRPTGGWRLPASEEEEDGEVIHKFDIRFFGEKVEDVNMCLRSLGDDYMIATAIRTKRRKEDGLSWPLGPYVELSLEEVLRYAEESG